MRWSDSLFKSYALLGICDRVIRARIPRKSVYRRLLKRVPDEPKTLGEHLRRKRVDEGMTNMQVAELFRVAYQTVERREHNRTPIGESNRLKIIAFLGYEPRSDDISPSS